MTGCLATQSGRCTCTSAASVIVLSGQRLYQSATVKRCPLRNEWLLSIIGFFFKGTSCLIHLLERRAVAASTHYGRKIASDSHRSKDSGCDCTSDDPSRRNQGDGSYDREKYAHEDQGAVHV